MPIDYLHNHKDFGELLRIVESEKGILAGLIEKDYWIMHALFGLQNQGYTFFLKGGTSLSKGYGLLDRFSEDIDILIEPAAGLNVNVNPRNASKQGVESRKNYYDHLSNEISIDGITSVERDYAFDDADAYRSGGIRLFYESHTAKVEGVKDGILLEAGFDAVTPFNRVGISSWAYDKASTTPGLELIDNRAQDIACYHPGYTFVEKLQTIATKFRQERADGIPRGNLMRQYYDLYCLLGSPDVQSFIATKEYQDHKQKRFPKVDYDIAIKDNPAFLLNDPDLKAAFAKRYQKTASLYFRGQPPFDALLARIAAFIERL